MEHRPRALIDHPQPGDHRAVGQPFLVGGIDLPGVVRMLGPSPTPGPGPAGRGRGQSCRRSHRRMVRTEGSAAGAHPPQLDPDPAAAPTGVLPAQLEDGLQRRRGRRWARPTGMYGAVMPRGAIGPASGVGGSDHGRCSRGGRVAERCPRRWARAGPCDRGPSGVRVRWRVALDSTPGQGSQSTWPDCTTRTESRETWCRNFARNFMSRDNQTGGTAGRAATCVRFGGTLGPLGPAVTCGRPPVKRGSPCRIISCVNQHANIRLNNRRNVASRPGLRPRGGGRAKEEKSLERKTEPAESLHVCTDGLGADGGPKKIPAKQGLTVPTILRCVSMPDAPLGSSHRRDRDRRPCDRDSPAS